MGKYEIRNYNLEDRNKITLEPLTVRQMNEDEIAKYGRPVNRPHETIFASKNNYVNRRKKIDLDIMFHLAKRYGISKKGLLKISEEMNIPFSTVKSYLYTKGIRDRFIYYLQKEAL